MMLHQSNDSLMDGGRFKAFVVRMILREWKEQLINGGRSKFFGGVNNDFIYKLAKGLGGAHDFIARWSNGCGGAHDEAIIQ